MTEHHLRERPIKRKTVGEQVQTIIKSLSVSVYQASRILKVSRHQIHELRKSEDFSEKDSRLERVFIIARNWENYGMGPMRDKNLMPCKKDRRSIVSLLSEEEIDTGEIMERMRLMAHDPSSYSETAGTGWREAFKKMGIEEPDPETQANNQEYNLRVFFRSLE